MIRFLFFVFTIYCLNKNAGVLKLLAVAVVGDNSTDTEEDARWTLGPQAPTGTDGWVGGTHTDRTCGISSSETRKNRERSHHHQ